MRKSSKLLAVLLTLCLLFGAITAVFVSAEEGEAQDPFNVTKHSANDYLDETTTSYNVKGVEKATYDSTREIKNLSYITLDFDITFTGNPTDTDTGRIRIFNKVSYYDTDGTAKGHNRTGGALYIYWNSGNPGIGGTSGISTNGDLNCVDGVYDHITVVMKPNAITSATNSLDGYQLTQSVYINGIQTGYKIAAAPNKEANILGVKAMYNGFSLLDVTNSGTVKIENVAVNHYTANDASLAECDAYSDVTPLYNIDGLVYNANYKTGNENKYIELSTGEKFYVPAGAAIGAKITDGATVTVKGLNIEDVNVPSDVGSFTVVEDGGTFSLSEMSSLGFEKSVNEDDNTVYTNKISALTDDCSNGGTEATYKFTDLTGNDRFGWAYNNSAKSAHVSLTYENASYARIHYTKGAYVDGASYLNRSAEVAWRAHATYSAATELTNNKFMTVDFDFGADRYAYTFMTGSGNTAQTHYITATTLDEAIANLVADGVTVTQADLLRTYTFTVDEETYTTEARTVTEAIANLAAEGTTVTEEQKTSESEGFDLAFPTTADGALTFTFQFVGSFADTPGTGIFGISSNDAWPFFSTNCRVYKLNGAWYIGAALNDTVNAAKLSGEVGVFDHITVVFEIGQDGETTVLTPHVYVNGEYEFDASKAKGTVTSTDKVKYDAKYHHFQQLMVIFGKNTTEAPSYKMCDRYSFAFDNMAVTYYDEADIEYNTTLDESMELREPLYTLDGVVYNEDYVTPNTDTYAKVGEETYYVVNAAFNNIQDGDTVYLYKAKAENVGYISAKSFSVVSDGNSTFTSWRCINEEGNNYRKIFDGQVQANVSIDSDGFRFHIYLPIDSSLPANCISWGGAYSNAAATTADTDFKSGYNFNFTHAGVNYYVITWNARTDMTGAKNAYFKLKYNNGETDFDLTDCFRGTFDQIAYMTRAAKEAECSGEDAQLIRAMMDYKVAFLNYISTEENYDAAESIGTIRAFYDIYDAHENDCACGTYEPEDKELTEKYINVGTKHDGLTLPTGIQLALGTGASDQRFYLLFKSTQAYTVFEIEYDNLRGERTTATINCGAKEEDAEYAASAALSNIKMYSIDNDFTVTAYQGTVDKDGNVIKGEQIGNTFTLSIADFPTSDANEGMITAIKNLAVVAENYKKYVIEQ